MIVESISTKYADVGVAVLSQDPWISTFDNLMDEEIIALLKTASDNGKKWEWSTDTGVVNALRNR